MPAKHGNKQYYKGSGSGAMGHFEKGAYIIDPKKVRQFVVPDLMGFPLKPYVSHTANKSQIQCIKTVQDYIDRAGGGDLPLDQTSHQTLP